jgi:anti-sigma factor RsiW
VDCSLIDSQLVGFHFGTLADDGRAQLEAHLIECPRCVGAFLKMKSAIERGVDTERPSDFLRARLRSSVRKELARRAPLRRWWVGGAAALAAAAALLVVLTRSPAPTKSNVNGTEDDSAAQVAESLNVM